MVYTETTTFRSDLIETVFKSVSHLTYCHWKSIDHLSAAFCALTDLDILVDRQSGIEFEYIIQKAGFIECQSAALRAYPNVKDFIGFDKSTNRLVHLHLHYQLICGDRWLKGYRLPVESLILTNRKYLKEFDTYIISPADEYILCVIRMSLKYRNPLTRSRVREELASIQRRDENISASIREKVVEYKLPSAMAATVIALIGENIAIANYQEKRIVFERHYYRRYSLVIFKLLTLTRLLYRIIIDVMRKKLNVFSAGRRKIVNGGCTVAFVGIDGSGKSTAISRNSKFFATHLDVVTVFMGGGQSGAGILRRLFFAGFRLLRYNKKYCLPSTTARSGNSMNIVRVVYHILLSIDRLRRLKKIHQSSSNGKLVLVDRWPQSQIANMLDGPRVALGEKPNDFIKQILWYLERKISYKSKVIQPNLVIRLNVAPEVSLKRKPHDLNVTSASKLADVIRRIEFDNIPTIDIDANSDAETVDRGIRAIIWENLS